MSPSFGLVFLQKVVVICRRDSGENENNFLQIYGDGGKNCSSRSTKNACKLPYPYEALGWDHKSLHLRNKSE